MCDTHDSTEDISLDALAEEFASKCRGGGCPSITGYIAKYPTLAQEIEEVFPTIALMEQVSRNEEADRSDTRRLRNIEQRLLDRLGDYRIVREIGRGGMGVVYEAIQESLGRTVALKVLTANVAQAPKQLSRFQREAHAAAMLHHTNIVPIFGVGHQDGLHYYVMQYMEGQSLDQLIRQQGQAFTATTPEDKAARDTRTAAEASRQNERTLTWPRIAEYGIQIARAVDYAHNQGILHRDIKPANLLVDTHDTICVTDFGLAKVFGDDGLTQSGDVFGTIRYMAPEQFEGKSTRWSDIYSIGVTLFELATGTPAFSGNDAKQLMCNITQQGLPRPLRAGRPIPKDLETIILKAAAFQPHHRYATAGDLADDLQRFQAGEPIAARRTTSLRRLWRWSCRNPALASLSGLSLTLLLLVAIVASIGLVRVEEARRRALNLAAIEQQRAAELHVANKRAQHEFVRARDESQRAEYNLQLAMQAFEDVMTRITNRGLPKSLELDNDWDTETRTTLPMLCTNEDADLLQSLLQFYEELALRNSADQRVPLETAKAQHRIGDIRQNLGQFDLALVAYQDALDIYQHVATSTPNNSELVRTMAEVWNQRGATLIQSGRVRESVEAHVAARDLLLEQPSRVAESPEHRFALAKTYNHLGAIWYRATSTGLPVFRIRRPGPLDHLPSERDRLPSTLEWMESNHHAALELLEQLVQQDPQNEEYRLALACCYRNSLALVWHGGEPHEVAQRLTTAIGILESLIDDFPDHPRYAFELADLLSIDMQELHDTEFGRTSWQRLEQAEQIARNLFTSFSYQPEYQTLYANALYRLGLSLYYHDQPELAVRHLTESNKHYQELLDRFPNMPTYAASLGRVAVDLGIMQRELGDIDDARQTFDHAIMRLIATYNPDTDLMAARRFIGILQFNRRITDGRRYDEQ